MNGKVWMSAALSCGALIASALTPQWTLPKLAKAPVIDGTIDPAEWANAQELTGFQLNTGKGPAKEQTRVYLGWDENYLYVAAYAYDSDVSQMGQGPIYDDCIEVFFMAPGNEDITHWLLHSNGTALLNFVDAEYGGMTHQPGAVQCAAKTHADGWSVEAALPASSYNLSQISGRFPWRGSVHRSFNHNLSTRNDGRGPEFSSVLPILGQYQRPLEFSQVELDSADAIPVRQTMVTAEKMAFTAPATAVVTARFNQGATQNIPGKEGFFEFTYPAGSTEVEVMVTDGPEVIFANRYMFPADTSAETAALKAQQMAQKGLGVGVEDSFGRIFHDLPYVGKVSEVTLEAARNEMEHFQVVLFTGADAAEAISLSTSDLTDAAGHKIAAQQFSFFREGYAQAGGIGYPTVRGAGDYPDPLFPLTQTLALKPGSVQPVWVQLKVPADTLPGQYTGTVTVKTGADTAATIPVQLEVYDLTIPVKHSLPTAFSLWETPLSRRCQGDAERFAELVDQYAMMLIEHRLTPIIMGTPFLQDEALVKDLAPRLEKQPDGSYKLYADRFDALMRKYLAAGATGFCVGPYLWGMMPEAGSIPADWPAMWQAVNAHYVANGLAPYAFAYPIDEPGNDQAPHVNALAKVIQENAPDIRVLITGVNSNFPSQRFSDIDIWVPSSHWINYRQTKLEQARGREVWYYPCSGPWYPRVNYHLDTVAAPWRAFAWATWRNGVDGILYWATAFFNGDNPFSNFAHGANGDGLLQYPDEDNTPLASLRLKVIADGMEDYEYLVQLRDAVHAARTAGKSPELIAEAEKLLTPDAVLRGDDDYAHDVNTYRVQRKKMVEMIHRLQQ